MGQGPHGNVVYATGGHGLDGFRRHAARNGIILVSRYRQLRAEGLDRESIVVEGSLERLAPILMTAAAAGLGLLPLIFGDIAGKELERPMAYVILGGLASSTFLNMLVVPSLYLKWGWDSEGAWQRQLALEKGEFIEPAPILVQGGAGGSSPGPATEAPQMDHENHA